MGDILLRLGSELENVTRGQYGEGSIVVS